MNTVSAKAIVLISLFSKRGLPLSAVRFVSPRLSFRAFSSALPISDGPHASGTIDISTLLRADTDKSVLESKISKSDADKTALKATISTAIANKKLSLWVDLPLPVGHGLIPTLDEIKFNLHHTDKNTLHYVKWLSPAPSRIPAYATHHVGVGGLILSPDRSRILLVRELHNAYSKWKVPGGLSDLGEGLEQAVTREVFEETGVKATFDRILMMRQTHKVQFGASDIYIVCLLKVDDEENFDICDLNRQESEIAEVRDVVCRKLLLQPLDSHSLDSLQVKWVDYDEFYDLVHVDEPHPMMMNCLKIVNEILNGQNVGFRRKTVKSIVPGRGESSSSYLSRTK